MLSRHGMYVPLIVPRLLCVGCLGRGPGPLRRFCSMRDAPRALLWRSFPLARRADDHLSFFGIFNALRNDSLTDSLRALPVECRSSLTPYPYLCPSVLSISHSSYLVGEVSTCSCKSWSRLSMERSVFGC